MQVFGKRDIKLCGCFTEKSFLRLIKVYPMYRHVIHAVYEMIHKNREAVKRIIMFIILYYTEKVKYLLKRMRIKRSTCKVLIFKVLFFYPTSITV